MADGMRAEFRLAKARGLYLLPVGASGWMALELWNEVMAEFTAQFPKNGPTIRPLLEAIGKSTAAPTDLLAPLLKLIDSLSKE